MDKVVYNHLTGSTETTTMSADEQASLHIGFASLDKKREAYKLGLIKEIRLEKLQETDFYALSDVTMSDAMSTYRQALRDIPQDYTTENEYDLLLARDEQGNLTHSVWSKP
jgi:enterochelin esterase-like enzyme